MIEGGDGMSPGRRKAFRRHDPQDDREFEAVVAGRDAAAGLSSTRCRLRSAAYDLTMRQHIGYVSLLVRDYDEAISYFTGQLGFGLVEDTNLGNGKRWVLIAPSGSLAGDPHPPGESGHRGSNATHWRSSRRARVFLLAHRRFLARLRSLSLKRRAVSGGTARGAVRNSCGL
jgi:Glyoxalase/Bleomycin resistance protein/Dioxygenase superfamily